MQPIVIARGLSKSYRGGVWALRDFDLELHAGELTLLVGPNGAGKSTLIRTILGFEQPTSGRVQLNGIDPSVDRASALTHLGYVAQDAPFYRSLTAWDHVRLAAAERDAVEPEWALDRLDRLDIPRRSRPWQLSGGQRAQLALTIALACRPAMLILDEPFASLDPLARRNVAADLRDSARSSGVGALLSSHAVGEAEGTCDRVVVLSHGVKRLDAAIPEALADHAVSEDADAVSPAAVIGRFPGPTGGYVAIYRRSDAPHLRAPNLEELVLGYLSQSRAAAGPRP